jgi:chromosome segregation ATPase
MAANSRAVLEPRQLNDADRAILDELSRGRASPSYLADQTGIEQTYINQRLRRLDEHDHVENLARGLWELTDDPRDDTPAEDVDEADLRARLQDALEARDDAQAKAERLEAELEDCREQLEQAQSGIDVDAIRRAIDDLEAACERGDGGAVQDAIGRLREAIDDES